ncbi:MAG: cation:proton antiporter [Kiritimatiellia bacterium]|nr:cation:proton antiporter [Kiritimatiellia bacterium]
MQVNCFRNFLLFKYIPRQVLLAAALLLPCCVFASTSGEEGGSMTERMMRLAIQIGVILFAAKLGNIVFERLKLPGVLGELCAGVLIGPYALGSVPIPLGGFEKGLFYTAEAVRVGGMEVSPELYGFCSVASIVLLFLVGLETDLKLFLRYAVKGSVVGIGGVIASFVTGDLVGMYFMNLIHPAAHYTFVSPACIFLGVMSTATSVSITARVLSERKKMETPEGVTILAGAVIDDVLGVVMLAIGMGVAKAASAGGIDWGTIGAGALKTITIWLVATVTAVMIARWISRGLKCFGNATAISIMALGLTMIVSGFFEEAHLAMIIGAYIMGLALSRTDISNAVRENLHPIATFLVPIFFTVMGMLVNVKPIFSFGGGATFCGIPMVLAFGLIYTVIAVFAKLIGCGAPLLLCGFRLRGALRVGVGMVPRGEVALIVAGIGLSNGMLEPDEFTVAIMMTLLTTLLAPPLLVGAFRSKNSGLVSKGQDAKEERKPLVYTFPSPEIASMLTGELLHVFEREGFFVHDLEMTHHHFQARKDAIIITMELQGKTMTFFCDNEQEESLAQTAITEVVAELETTLSVIRRASDLNAVVKAEQPIIRHIDRIGGRLAKYIDPELMLPDLRNTSAEGIIREMVSAIAAKGLVSDAEETVQTVLRREQAMPTGLRHGLACPHGRTASVNKLICAVGICRKGAEFVTIDGGPAHIIILILSPTEGGNAPYMEFIAAIRDVFNETGRAALLSATTPEQMADVLRK